MGTQVIETQDDDHARRVAVALVAKVAKAAEAAGQDGVDEAPAQFRTVTGQNGRVAFELAEGFDPGTLPEATTDTAGVDEAPAPTKAAKDTKKTKSSSTKTE